MATLEERSSRRRRFYRPPDRPPVNFASAWGSASSNSHSERGLQHRSSPVHNKVSTRWLETTLVFNNRAPFPLCYTSLLLRPHFSMANTQHDPVVAQLERQKLTASPSHLDVFFSYFLFNSTFSPSLAHCEPKLRRRANAPLRECC